MNIVTFNDLFNQPDNFVHSNLKVIPTSRIDSFKIDYSLKLILKLCENTFIS